jgi:23S rRNA pseudouridine2604 synthase
MLNNEVAVAGNRYREGDEVVVDGSILKPANKEKMIMMAFNKPVGVTTTTDENIRGNIISFINYPKRIFPIGRLDKDSEGLIFLTNNGDIVNKILRAGNEHEKEYLVRVDRNIDGAFLKAMSEGVRIDGVKTLPCRLRQTGKHSFNIILVQGLNRQIRKMCEALGYKVTALQRIRIMDITLGKLAVGKWRYLSEPEIASLNSATERSVKEANGKTYKKEKDPGPGMRDKGSDKIPKKAAPAKVSRTAKPAPGAGEERRSTKKTSYKDFRKKGKKR